MKKILSLVFVTTLIIPSLAFASWWNPTSWFDNWSFTNKTDTKTEILEKRIQELESNLITQKSIPIITKFYIKYDDSRVRSCASTGCDAIWYYPQNTEITMQGQATYKLSDLAEWIEFTTSNGLKGFINKSILSETPIAVTKNIQNDTNSKISDASVKTIRDAITTITKERQTISDEISTNSSGEYSNYLRSYVDVQDVFFSNITTILGQINLVYNEIINDPYNVKSQLEKYEVLIARYNKLYNQYEIDKSTALSDAISNARNSIANTRAQAVNDAYRQAQVQQNAIYQAQLDATNAQIEQYKSIRAAGAANGATQAVVNAQLNAAGLIKQTNCSFSSVGGMTPGAGSVTCY